MITDKTVIDALNRRLLSEFRVLDGRPIYRVVWSADQLEVRKGMFTDWYGHIMIRQEYKAVRQIKKYWYFTKPCWVLEKLVFIRGNQALKEISEELVEARNGTYETIFPFKDKEENALPVNERVVLYIINKLHNPTKTSPSDIKDLEELEEKEEVKYFEEELAKDARPDLFIWDNSAFVSTRQLEFQKQRTYIEKDTQITGVKDAVTVIV